MSPETLWYTPPAYRPGGGGGAVGVLTTERQAFLLDGAFWWWLGCSAFPLAHLYETQGEGACDRFLDQYPGLRVPRVWDYVGSGWGARAWNSTPPVIWVSFVRYLNARGLMPEITLLTDDDPARHEGARRLVEALKQAGGLQLLLETGNEPETHKDINTAALRGTVMGSGFPCSSGNYENSHHWYGTHGTYHPQRTRDFARRAHDAFDYFHGGGPNDPSEPACPVPWVNDEPAKLADVPRDWVAWRSHIAASLLFGSGFTLHSESGKFCDLPSPDEQFLWGLVIEVASLIEPDAALGAYRRIRAEDEPGQTPEGRTYVFEGRQSYMVRCQQAGTAPPEADKGWRPLDTVGVLFTR